MINQLPQELFHTYYPDKERVYKFVGMNGKPKKIILGKNDRLLPKKCPLDGANLVAIEDNVYGSNEHCYCCGGPDISTSMREDLVEKYISNEYSHDLENKINKMKEDLSRLEDSLSLAKHRDSGIIKSNRENSLYTKKPR